MAKALGIGAAQGSGGRERPMLNTVHHETLLISLAHVTGVILSRSQAQANFDPFDEFRSLGAASV